MFLFPLCYSNPAAALFIRGKMGLFPKEIV